MKLFRLHAALTEPGGEWFIKTSCEANGVPSGGLDTSMMARMTELEDENRRLRTMTGLSANYIGTLEGEQVTF